MANPERISIKTDHYGQPLEISIDPRSAKPAGLRSIVKTLMDQAIQYGNSVLINIYMPGIDGPLQYGREDFLRASKDEREEFTLNAISDLLLGAEKLTIRNHRFVTGQHFFDESADIFKRFVEKEMKAEF